MTITEKVAFLKGLIEGSELKLDKKEEKIFNMVVEILDEVAGAVTELDEDVSVLYDDVEDISDALDDIDDAIYHIAGDLDSREDDDDDDFMYEIQCEKCGEKLCIDEDTLLGDDIVCPSCGEPIEFEFDCDCDECEDDCCGHDHDDDIKL